MRNFLPQPRNDIANCPRRTSRVKPVVNWAISSNTFLCFIIWIQFGCFNYWHLWGKKSVHCVFHSSHWFSGEIPRFCHSFFHNKNLETDSSFPFNVTLSFLQKTDLTRFLSSHFEQFMFPNGLKSQAIYLGRRPVCNTVWRELYNSCPVKAHW